MCWWIMYTLHVENMTTWTIFVSRRKFCEHKIVIIFLPINLNMCFGCSKEPSHLGSSFEYPQHMFWMKNTENSFPICTLIWSPVQWDFGSYCLCEQPRLRRACEYAQSRLSLRCFHTQSRDVNEVWCQVALQRCCKNDLRICDMYQKAYCWN